MTRRLQCTLAIFALAAALLPMSAAGVPADTADAPTTVEKATLLRLLNADSVAKQERAVRLIGTYAHAGRYGEEYFRVFVTPLHGLVATGETDGVRIMAVSALASIGTDAAFRGLKAQVDNLTPERVRRLTQYALAHREAEQTGMRSGRPQP